jgi:hypothetical protein
MTIITAYGSFKSVSLAGKPMAYDHFNKCWTIAL